MAVPDMLAPSGDAYVLKVRGDSMIEAHIADGDFVLIRPQTTARNGDIVVAQVEENAVTLKRFFKEKDQIRLQPANPAYPPQFYDDVRIQGKLIGVIRTARLSGGARSLGRHDERRPRARRQAPRARWISTESSTSREQRGEVRGRRRRLAGHSLTAGAVTARTIGTPTADGVRPA